MLKRLMAKLRRSPFDFNTREGRTIGDMVTAPLEQSGVDCMVVDVGARNGMMLLPDSYTRRARLVGFEPNLEEYGKLVAGDTDAHKIGARISPFKTEKYFPFALWDKEEDRTFYITKGPGACTLLGAADQRVTNNMFLDYSSDLRHQSYQDLHTEVVGTQPVACQPLDALLEPNTVVDFLKMDVEGAEHQVLQGARQLLKRKGVLFIYSEFAALPYYKAHDVFGYQHALLTEHGYRLLDLDLGHLGYRRGATDFSSTVDRSLIYGGDAFFALDPDRNQLSRLDLQRLAAISLSFGFISFAFELLREAGFLSDNELMAIKDAVEKTWTVERLKKVWMQLPARARAVLHA